jgi:hypothetical protein
MGLDREAGKGDFSENQECKDGLGGWSYGKWESAPRIYGVRGLNNEARS